MAVFVLPIVIIYLVNDRQTPEIQSWQTLRNLIC